MHLFLYFIKKMSQKKSKTLRLIYPQWQGGINPNYATGSEVLSLILPKGGSQTEVLEVPVEKDFSKEGVVENGIYEESTLINQIKCAYNILQTKNPDKVITRWRLFHKSTSF